MTKYLPDPYSMRCSHMVRTSGWHDVLPFSQWLSSLTSNLNFASASCAKGTAVWYRKSRKIIACNERPYAIVKVLGVLGLAALLWTPDDAAFAQQDEVIKGGQELFGQKCAICHGQGGKGDGVLGLQLKKRPADLSQLSKRNTGVFPFWQTYGKIDGREEVGAHGPDDMPVWGTDERYEGSRGRLARGQILEIVFFLQSIQEE